MPRHAFGHQERVLRMFAEIYSKVSPEELALEEEDGRLTHQLLTVTLEQLCSLWLRQHKPAAGAPPEGALHSQRVSASAALVLSSAP